MRKRKSPTRSWRRQELRRKLLCLAVLIIGLALASSIGLQAQTVAQSKEVAVTIDDLPLNGPRFEAGRLRAMTDKIGGDQ